MKSFFLLSLMIYLSQHHLIASENPASQGAPKDGFLSHVVFEIKNKDGSNSIKLELRDRYNEGVHVGSEYRVFSYDNRDWTLVEEDQSLWSFFNKSNLDISRDIARKLTPELRKKIYIASLEDEFKETDKIKVKEGIFNAQKKRPLSDEEEWILQNFLN